MSNWKKILSEIVNQPALHARFLNTLSLLEYIGSRKIMKSQREDQITPTTLAHMAEEIRHAQILKKIALKVGGQNVLTYQEDSLLCGNEGRAYIQAIDHEAEKVLNKKDSWVNYLLTTLVIEERAQELYPLYDELLAPLGLNSPIKAIIREEVEHLKQVIELLKTVGGCTEEKIQQVRDVEKKYFADFFTAVALEMKNLENILETRV